jgi:cysteine desulfurase
MKIDTTTEKLKENPRVSRERIYLDYNATSPMRSGVLEAMRPFLAAFYGNPSSIHEHGRHARNGIEESRGKISKCLGARRDQFIFTGGGSESINLALKGVAFALEKKGHHIITTAVEHEATLRTCQYLAETFGFSLTVLPVDSTGLISLEALAKAITPQTILLTLIHAQNEIGVIQPIQEMVEIAHEKNVLVHADGVQAVGKIPVDLSRLNIDLYSFSSHKIGGPKGVGALFVRDDLKIHPLIHGGHHERDLRAGTENVAGIVGFGEAAKILLDEEPRESVKLSKLKSMLAEGFKKVSGFHFNGHPVQSLPNTLNVSFDGVEGLALVLNLDLEGISVSTGSACLSGGIEPSPVLKVLGLEDRIAQGAVRFSLGWQNTEAEIETVIDAVSKIVKQLRKVGS